MAKEEANFLQSLLNKNLRITTTDSRMFWGQFKCTDPVLTNTHSTYLTIIRLLIWKQDSNIILAHTYEYRQPSLPKKLEGSLQISESNTVKVDMTSRYLGLVVVPGEHIVKIEVEEFASQMRGQNPYQVGVVV